MNKVLGIGSYGRVYLGRQDNTGEDVAVKILCKDSSSSLIIIVDREEYLKAALKN
jgi:serine/threonine protein kinase